MPNWSIFPNALETLFSPDGDPAPVAQGRWQRLGLVAPCETKGMVDITINEDEFILDCWLQCVRQKPREEERSKSNLPESILPCCASWAIEPCNLRWWNKLNFLPYQRDGFLVIQKLDEWIASGHYSISLAIFWQEKNSSCPRVLKWFEFE